MNRGSLHPALITSISLATLALLWTALQRAGVNASDWYVAAGLIGLACAFAALGGGVRGLSPIAGWGRLALIGAGAYIILQVVPVPVSLLRVLDPNRALLFDAAARAVPTNGWAPIAVNQPAAILWASTLFGAAALFYVVRSFAAASRGRLWLALLPLFFCTLLEATVGLLQVGGGAPWASGTFNSRDHYCCFLELTVPLLAAAGVAAMPQARTAREFTLRRAAASCGAWALTLVLLTAIFYSLSRAGAFSALIGLAVFAAFSLAPLLPSRRARLALGTVLMTTTAVALVAFTPSALLKRLFETGSADSATRVAFWRESVPIVAHFPVFGVGLMGFESTFLRYQDVLLTKRVDFAHNDYLQYLIELGAAGFALAVVALAAVLWPAIKGAWSSHDTRSRVWLTGCIASFVELALHSAVDFNLYVPANLLAFAWIAAFASVIASGPARLQPTHPA